MGARQLNFFLHNYSDRVEGRNPKFGLKIIGKFNIIVRFMSKSRADHQRWVSIKLNIKKGKTKTSWG